MAGDAALELRLQYQRLRLAPKRELEMAHCPNENPGPELDEDPYQRAERSARLVIGEAQAALSDNRSLKDSTFDFSEGAMRVVNEIVRLRWDMFGVSQKSPPTDEERATAVAKALGTYRLLLSEVASGGIVLVRRRNRATFAVNLR